MLELLVEVGFAHGAFETVGNCKFHEDNVRLGVYLFDWTAFVHCFDGDNLCLSRMRHHLILSGLVGRIEDASVSVVHIDCPFIVVALRFEVEMALHVPSSFVLLLEVLSLLDI